MGNHKDDCSGLPPALHPLPTAQVLTAVLRHREPMEESPIFELPTLRPTCSQTCQFPSS